MNMNAIFFKNLCVELSKRMPELLFLDFSSMNCVGVYSGETDGSSIGVAEIDVEGSKLFLRHALVRSSTDFCFELSDPKCDIIEELINALEQIKISKTKPRIHKQKNMIYRIPPYPRCQSNASVFYNYENKEDKQNFI